MASPPFPGSGLSTEQLRAADVVCSRFEEAWQHAPTTSPGPEIEPYVEGHDGPMRLALLKELIRIDLHYRGRRGSMPSSDEYSDRFPELEPTWLEQALAGSTARGTDPAPGAGATGSFRPSGDGAAPTVSVDPSGGIASAPPRPGAASAGRGASPRMPRYEILGELGRGGMGVVYRARQVGLDRIVALKMILGGAHARPEDLDRFRAEALAVARLRHPNIVQIFDVGEHEGLPYFSLEFVEGGSLSKHLDGKPMAPREAAELTATIARAVDVAHQSRIVHRDLKPANILLTADGQPKIADFGLAKLLEEEPSSDGTRTGSVMGTPSYMAPEQAWGQGDKIGPAADIYALGAILYDLVTGRPPFKGTTPVETLDLVRSAEPAPPTQLQPKLPRDLETICLKCLHKDVDRRYDSARDLADDLQRYLEGRPILARPVSAPERAWRWARRNRVVASLGSAFILSLVGATVVSSVFYFRAEEARSGEAKQRATAESALKKEEIARGKEEEAHRVADQAYDEASNRLAQAVRAIRVSLLEVQDRLRERPELLPIRSKILRAMQTELDNIKESFLKNPLVYRTEAGIWVQLAGIYLDLGQVGHASEIAEKAYAILGAQARAHPEDPVAVRNLAAVANALGDVQIRLGKLSKARERYTEGLRLRKRWAELLPQHAPAHQAIAESHSLLGRADLLLGRPDAALADFEAARKEYQALPPRLLAGLQTRRELAALDENFGRVRLELGDIEGAEKAHRSALTERVALLKLTKSPILLHDVTLSQDSLGDLYRTASRDPVKAWNAYEKALRNFGELLKVDPQAYRTRQNMAMILYKAGETSRTLKATGKTVTAPVPQPGLADTYFAECLRLRKELAAIDPNDTQPRIELMLALARCGQGGEAERMAEALLKSAGDDTRLIFQAACGFALSAECPDIECADCTRCRAFDALDALVNKGWTDQVRLETDPDLDPVRSDSRFAATLSRIAPPPVSQAKPGGAGSR